MQFQYGIFFTTRAVTSSGGDYGHSLCSACTGKTITTFLWFGGTSSNYIYQQAAILWLQKYEENGYIIFFVALKIFFTKL